MPRLPPSLIIHASKKSPLLPLVLQGTRTLDSAINELRWLREHVQSLNPVSPQQAREQLLKLCQRRSRAEPLQYILGSQPFGELDIICRPGVLIPRPETEAYTTYLAELLRKGELHPKLGVDSRRGQTQGRPLRIMDLCSGSGCISLLLHHLLSRQFPYLKIFGFDISPRASELAQRNLTRNVKCGHINSSAIMDNAKTVPQVQFGTGNIFDRETMPMSLGSFDILISNPPYISQRQYETETTRSVRNYEPRMALIPPPKSNYAKHVHKCKEEVDAEDLFYHRLLKLHSDYKSRVLLMEVGDAEQAVRVAEMALNLSFTKNDNRVEVWRDDPRQEENHLVVKEVDGHEILVRGAGKVRAVALFRTTRIPPKQEPTMTIERLSDLPKVSEFDQHINNRQQKVEDGTWIHGGHKSAAIFTSRLPRKPAQALKRIVARKRKVEAGTFGQEGRVQLLRLSTTQSADN